MSFRLPWLSECLKPRNFFWSLVPAGGWSVLQMSPSNEDASVAQWYGLGTLNPRTCSIFRHGKGLSREPYDDLFGSTRLSQSGIHLFIYLFYSRRGTGLSQEPSNRRNRPTVPVYSIAPHDFSHPYRGNRSTGPVYWTDRLFLLFYWPTILLHSQNCAFRS